MSRRSLLLVVTLAAVGPVAAQASQEVTIVIPEVERIQVSAGTRTLAFVRPPEGGPFADVIDDAGSYDVTVNTSGNKITAALDAPFADGVRLSVRLEAPPGAVSHGRVELATEARDLVTGVGGVAAAELSMTYTASADPSALPNGAGETHVVTYTVTDQ
ncbi:hypothetical protein [Rubrivirga marina]|uniref:Uncharacterized protein n=1 Tax=Rubrivirga marina TaxID=1196024 RepID=A0A271IZI4_9BACT|nr:hypothetical protein [Rubrivirga marina]PAP76115.1 hypothetical protein BSZ37_06475 [Rubrivirga marina]